MNLHHAINASDLKPNKKQAFAIVKELIAISEKDIDIELGQLYNFFLPSIPAKPKTDMQWVSKALEKKGTHRPQLVNAYSDGETLVGTDGHRMHWLENSHLPTGFYNSQEGKLDLDDLVYPDFKRVIPSKVYTWSGNFADCEKREVTGYLVYIFHSDGHSKECAFNKQFIDQALSGMDNPDFCLTEDGQRLHIKDGLKNAVIMAVRV